MINEKEIYSNRKMSIFEEYYEGYPCYSIRLPNGYCAVFNHSKQILDLLMDMVSKGLTIYRDYKGNLCLYFGKKKYMALAKFLYCAYNEIKEDKTVFMNNVRHRKRKERTTEDCRKENLYVGGSSVFYDETGKYIIAVSNTNEFTDIFTAVPVIDDILRGCSSLQPNSGDRVMAKYKGEQFPVGDLAYLAYYDSSLTVDNFGVNHFFRGIDTATL